MAFGSGGLSRSQSSINITPLIDVLLVLLIIFMIVTPILTKGMQSDIPQKVNQPLPPEYTENQLVVHIGADGSLLLNSQPVGLLDLSGRLRALFAQRGGKRLLFLDADNAVNYGTVIQVMDICRDGGAETIGVVPDSVSVKQ